MIDTYLEQSMSDRRPRDEPRQPPLKTTIAGVGTATPSTSYSQEDLLEVFAVRNRRVRSLFLNSHIDRRYLTLPSPDANGLLPKESQAELLKKHRACAVDLGASAVLSCLRSANATTVDISFLCCVTTTGFLSPGVSAYLCRALDLSPSCARLDVVGMGCNGGLNALNVVSLGGDVQVSLRCLDAGMSEQQLDDPDVDGVFAKDGVLRFYPGRRLT